MATTTTQSPPTDPSSTTGPSISPSNGTGPTPLSSNTPSVSLVLYIFSVILALFVTIFAALVTRSVRRRRQRNAAFVAALASGRYGPHRGNQDGAPESKPILWEALITSVYDEKKGWAGLSPVSGEASVPADEAKTQQPASRQPRLRFPHPGGTRPAAPNLAPTTPPLESLASSSNPIYLTVLVSMPSPRAHERPRQGNEGPPVVELGVAEVTCTPKVA